MSMNIYAIKGHRVKFYTLEAGRDYEKKEIKKILKLGEMYTVDYTIVHSSNTEVYLQEFPGQSFNSVFFCDVKKQLKRILKRILTIFIIILNK